MGNQNVTFDPSGLPVKFELIFKGIMIAFYKCKLWEANSNIVLSKYEGNNENTDDDVYKLPLPLNLNDGRLLQASASFYAPEPDNLTDYIIEINIYQGDERIGGNKQSGKLTGQPQDSLMFFKFKSK